MVRKIRNREPKEVDGAKVRRIAIGATIAGVLLIVFLVVLLSIQFAKIGVKAAEKNKLEDQIEQYKELNRETENDLEFYKTEEGLRMLAVMNGWTKDSGGK